MILHCLSGGIDSASVLWQLKDCGIALHHIVLKDGGRRWLAESAATAAILKWFATSGKTFEIIRDSGVWGLPAGSQDIEVAGLMCGTILRRRVEIDSVTISTSQTDRTTDATWRKRNAVREGVINLVAGRTIKVVAPNYDKTREQVIREMPPDLLRLCAFCRNPSGILKACGTCQTCKQTIPFLNE